MAKEYWCEYFNANGSYLELTLQYNEDYWYWILCYASGLFSFFFFLVVYKSPELQVHPMKLIMV